MGQDRGGAACGGARDPALRHCRSPLAPTRARAAEVVRTTKQYLLHHGYEARLSTAGNLAFPFTPPEVSVGPAYRFNVYHLMRASDLDALFPLEIETV